MSHGPLTWVCLGAALSSLLVAPIYYWKGVKDGTEKAAERWKAGR
jgi:hypothetical protein